VLHPSSIQQPAACSQELLALPGAERLYVTPCTVETHLTHAFAKLDIRSRAELAAALQPAPADSGTLTVM
jgi:hypothetical protein